MPKKTPIGEGLIKQLLLLREARKPALLSGPTGIGKSDVAQQLAKKLQIGYRVLELSQIQPFDILGIPSIVNGETRFNPPAELPTGGEGILHLEEINRCPQDVAAAVLQLISAGTTHGGYRLPEGWSIIATINPEKKGGYLVNPLDPAMLNRFHKITVGSSRTEWLAWGMNNGIHAAILTLLETSPEAFDDLTPRKWEQNSRLIYAWEKTDGQIQNLMDLLAMELSEIWCEELGALLTHTYSGIRIEPEVLLTAEPEAAKEMLAPLLLGSTDERRNRLARVAAQIREMIGASETRWAQQMAERINASTLEYLIAEKTPFDPDLAMSIATAITKNKGSRSLLQFIEGDPADINNPDLAREIVLYNKQSPLVARLALAGYARRSANWKSNPGVRQLLDMIDKAIPGFAAWFQEGWTE